MNHKVINVQELYNTASDLYNNVVSGGGTSSADSILRDLEQAVLILKDNWKGIDAGLKIQEVIKVHNEMVVVRNALAQLAFDSSKVAANYREIQITNGAPLEGLSPVNISHKSNLDDYSDSQDTIDINPEAEHGKNLIDNANMGIDGFLDIVSRRYAEIMDNWLVGTGRDAAQGAFDEFVSNAKKYKNTLFDVSQSIKAALNNYSF